MAHNTEIYDLKYFWEEKGDIERYCHFEKLMTHGKARKKTLKNE